ncbi:MAG: hypothetical protein ACRD9Q_00435 [Nitrososphaeraceae archaeon]
MYFFIDDKSGDVLLPRMKNWIQLQEIINSTDLGKNRIMHLAHQGVKYKLEAANMHINMLTQAQSNIIKETSEDEIGPVQIDFLRRTMMDNIIFNLSSLLDSIAHEINQIYQFNIDFKRIQIDHQSNDKVCLRCRLDDIKDDLASYLNWELPKLNQDPAVDRNSWYTDFSAYRNQIMHRTIFFLHLMPGAAFLPDDPTILDSQGFLFDENGKPVFNGEVPVMKNVEHQRELRSYSSWCFNKILEITENIYKYLIEVDHR